MGENVWRSENEWPLARTQYTNYYLHSAGAANTLNGDGALSTEPPTDEPTDGFTYDPDDPVWTLGGQIMAIEETVGGPLDRRTTEQRADVLVYTTEPLERDVEVTGPVWLSLFASSSAPDTDFTGTLVDVHPTAGHHHHRGAARSPLPGFHRDDEPNCAGRGVRA